MAEGITTSIEGHSKVIEGYVSITNHAGRRILFGSQGDIILRNKFTDEYTLNVFSDKDFNELWTSLNKLYRVDPGNWQTLRRMWELYDREEDPENKERRLNDLREYSDKIQDRSDMLTIANEKLNHLANIDMQIIQKAAAYDAMVNEQAEVVRMELEYGEREHLLKVLRETLEYVNKGSWLIPKKKLMEILLQ